MKRLFSTLLVTLLLSVNATAGSDGENELSKKNKVVLNPKFVVEKVL